MKVVELFAPGLLIRRNEKVEDGIQGFRHGLSLVLDIRL
jgi:hypothetical protein